MKIETKDPTKHIFTDEDWAAAELRPNDILLRELEPPEAAAQANGVFRPQTKERIRRWQIVKVGEKVEEIDPRIQVNKICMLIVELARTPTHNGYIVVQTTDDDLNAISLTFPLEYFNEQR